MLCVIVRSAATASLAVYARGKSYVNPALVLYVLKTRGRNTRVGLTATKK